MAADNAVANNREAGLNPSRDNPVPAVSIEPNAIESDLFTGQSAEEVLTITNDGREAVTFESEITILGQPDRDGRGPFRDDPGELLAQFNGPLNNLGVWVDGELMWMSLMAHPRLPR
jgi:hypothetical protein